MFIGLTKVFTVKTNFDYTLNYHNLLKINQLKNVTSR